MKKKTGAVPNKPSKYYQEIIIDPAEKLLKALIDVETKEKVVPKKLRKTAIAR